MNSTSRPPVGPAQALAQMLVGNQVQQAIYVAAKLGIADLLHEGSRTSDELAAAAGAHPDALYRLLRALAGIGIFAECPRQRFELTPMGNLLRSGTPESVLPFALWSGGVSYRAFGGLEHSVRTGNPAFEHIFGTEFFDYLATHPESGTVFDDMMSRHTAPVARAIADYDLPGAGTVVDVGGGRGELLAAILSANPAIRGILVDQPRVLVGARAVFEHAGVADRGTAVAGDILEAVPAGDAYLLKSVLHGLSDRDAVRVLGNCRAAMHPDGRLLVIEFVLPAPNEPSPGRLMDLLMLVGCHGRERTAEEFEALFDTAGLRLAGVAATRHGYRIVEGRAAQRVPVHA